MAYAGTTVRAAGLRSGDKVLRQLPAVSWVVFRVVSDGSGGGDVHVISTTNDGLYFRPDQKISIRRDPDFCPHCTFGWRAGGTGPVNGGWCPRHPDKARARVRAREHYAANRARVLARMALDA